MDGTADLKDTVIPGHRKAMNPESRDDQLRDSGFALMRAPGMTNTELARIYSPHCLASVASAQPSQ
jgi:hypothetical protein